MPANNTTDNQTALTTAQKLDILSCFSANTWQEENTVSKTDDQKLQETYVKFWGTTLTSAALIITLISTLFSGYVIPKTSDILRIELCQVTVVIIFVLSIYMIWAVETVNLFFKLTIACVIFVILAAMTTQCSWFAIAGPMPYNYVMTFMEGQGVGGIFISILVVVLNRVFKNPETGTWYDRSSVKQFSTVYFSITILTTILTMIAYQFIFKQCSEYKKLKLRENSDEPEVEQLTEKPSQSEPVPTTVILRSVWKQILSTFATFFVFLSLFPAVLTSITSEYSSVDVFGIRQANWTFINYALFMLYSVGDWVGKRLGNAKSFDYSKENLLLLASLARIPVFYLLFACCDLTGTRSGVLASSWFFIAVMVLFSVSQGYFGCIPMGHAPQVFKMKHGGDYSEGQVQRAQGRIMPIMVTTLIAGLLAGALFSGINTAILVDIQNSERQQMQFATLDKLFS